MTLSFRPAKRSEAKPLIGLYAESGAGKTLSALLLARGFVGPTGKVGMIETESGRGEAYADDPRVPGSYSVLSMRDDFSPVAFGEAIHAAEKDDCDALIIDSASHEWEAVGGVLHMAAQNEAAGKKGVLVWQQPKMDHSRHFMLRLLGTPIPLVIVCMRARYPMQEKGKGNWQRSETLVPFQSDTILFEMFAHGWIDREHKFHGTKWTRDELKQVLREGEPITLETGQRLAAWAKGGTTAARESPVQRAQSPGVEPGATSGGGTGGTPETTTGVNEGITSIKNVRMPSAMPAAAPADWEIVVNDFAERFDEVKYGQDREAKGWKAAWEKRRAKGDIPPEGDAIVEAAIQRARGRLGVR